MKKPRRALYFQGGLRCLESLVTTSQSIESRGAGSCTLSKTKTKPLELCRKKHTQDKHTNKNTQAAKADARTHGPDLHAFKETILDSHDGHLGLLPIRHSFATAQSTYLSKVKTGEELCAFAWDWEVPHGFTRRANLQSGVKQHPQSWLYSSKIIDVLWRKKKKRKKEAALSAAAALTLSLCLSNHAL